MTNKRRGAEQEWARELSGIRLILVKMVHWMTELDCMMFTVFRTKCNEHVETSGIKTPYMISYERSVKGKVHMNSSCLVRLCATLTNVSRYLAFSMPKPSRSVGCEDISTRRRQSPPRNFRTSSATIGWMS